MTFSGWYMLAKKSLKDKPGLFLFSNKKAVREVAGRLRDFLWAKS